MITAGTEQIVLSTLRYRSVAGRPIYRCRPTTTRSSPSRRRRRGAVTLRRATARWRRRTRWARGRRTSCTSSSRRRSPSGRRRAGWTPSSRTAASPSSARWWRRARCAPAPRPCWSRRRPTRGWRSGSTARTSGGGRIRSGAAAWSSPSARWTRLRQQHTTRRSARGSSGTANWARRTSADLRTNADSATASVAMTR